MSPELSLGRRGVALSQEKQIGYCLRLRLSVNIMIAARTRTRMQGQIAAPGSSPAAWDLRGLAYRW